jgi:hypothetical protein
MALVHFTENHVTEQHLSEHLLTRSRKNEHKGHLNEMNIDTKSFSKDHLTEK